VGGERLSRHLYLQGGRSEMAKSKFLESHIIVDTREQLPWTWMAWKEKPKLVRDGLSTGDYTMMLDGEILDWLIVVERKELGDFIGCCTSGRDRFERELERMQASCMHPYVAIEASLQDIAEHRYRSRMLPKSVLGSVCAWELDFPKVHFHWLGTRLLAEAWCYRKFLAVERRIKADKFSGGEDE
jgi:DNA excision repair protein ERCC-4